MNRTLRFFRWQEGNWRRRGVEKEIASREPGGPEPLTPEHAEGLKAYAERQARLCFDLRRSCERQWVHVDSMIKMASMEVKDPKLLFARRERERVRLMSTAVSKPGLAAMMQPPTSSAR